MKGMKRKLACLLAGVVLLGTAALCACSSQGKNGKDFSLKDAYQEVCEQGYTGSYEDFIREYLQINVSGEQGLLTSSAVNSAVLSTVSIQVACEYKYGSGISSAYSYSLGSGVIYQLDRAAGNATVLTNCHVVYDAFEDSFDEGGYRMTRTGEALEYTMYLYGLEDDAHAIPFEVVGYSQGNDVAVLNVEGSQVLRDSLAIAASLGDSETVAVGDEVFLIGNALGQGISATRGIVSVESETTTVENASNTGYISVRSIRTDAAANEGNSGGGFFDANGRLIGLLFAGDTEAEGIGDCLPLTNVLGVADSILRHCDGNTVNTVKVSVGAEVGKISTVQYCRPDGKITTKDVVSVYSTSGLCAGKLEEGDVILSVSVGEASKAVDHPWQIGEFLWRVEVGDEIVFTVQRSGETNTVRMTAEASAFRTVG